MKKTMCFLISLTLALAVGAASCTEENKNSALEGWEKLGREETPDDGNGGSSTTPPDDGDNGNGEETKWFLTRGVICGWEDVQDPETLDYIDIAKNHGLNSFSIYGAPRSSSTWKNFMADCDEAGIAIEFQEHMMYFLLPRSLFSTHPEYFRMNSQGVRVDDANGCPSSEEALRIVKGKAAQLGESYKPTNHKYYFWMDDGGDICYCPNCRQLSASDQALIFENATIEGLKEIDPEAKLAHLSYAGTTDAPKSVTPHEDIFLEFAPFWRSWKAPLVDTWTSGANGMTHAKYLRALHDNLEVFPAETAQVLEYWMDDSMWSGWDKTNLQRVPWSLDIFKKDIDTYAGYGIRHMTCYTAYVGPAYVEKFGFPDFLVEYADYLSNYKKK